MRRAALLLPLACSLGCLPWPHTVRLSPQIAGTLVEDARPLAGVPVRLEVNGEPHASTTTDVQGRFAFPGATRFDLLWVFGDPLFEWRVIFELVKGARGWSASRLGYVPPSQTASCAVDGGDLQCACSEDRGEGAAPARCESL